MFFVSSIDDLKSVREYKGSHGLAPTRIRMGQSMRSKSLEMLIVQHMDGARRQRVGRSSGSVMAVLFTCLGLGCSPSPSAKKGATPAPVAKDSAAKPALVAAYRGPSVPTTLSLQSAQGSLRSGLNVRSDASLELALALPSGDSWNRARVGRAVLRQPDGSQVELGGQGELESLRSQAKAAPLAMPELMPGTSMIIVSAGPGDAGPGRDDMAGNRHFSKLIVSKADASGKIPKVQAGVMQKTGQPLEIRPVTLPMALRLGDEMSVKVYENQSHRGNAEIEIHHPDGEIEVLHTQANGMAHFEVRRVGVHHIVFNTQMEQEPASAQLTFEVTSPKGETK